MADHGGAGVIGVMAAALERIGRLEAAHNAMYVVDEAGARAAAEASARRWERGTARGVLDGVPVTVKENTAKKGFPMGWGTAACSPVAAAAGSPVVDRLEEAGAIVVGSTTMPDLSGLGAGVSSRHGITRNAWNPAWNSGGSSAGAAVAAALGYAPINIGTDFGGSIRIPAAMNGVVGFKPTYGRVPLLDAYAGHCAGPLTRTVADAAAAMAVLSLPDARDRTALPYEPVDWLDLGLDPAGMTLGLNLSPVPGKAAKPEVVAAVEAAAATFAAAGARVEPVPPYLDEEQIGGWITLHNAHLWAQLHDPAIVDDPGRALPALVEIAALTDRLTPLELITGLERILPLAARTRSTLARYDAVLSPTTSATAPPAESLMFELGEGPNFTSHFNAAGNPAASVNCGFDAAGKPVGLQIAASPGADLRVLRLAGWYEANRPPTAAPDWRTLDAVRT